MKAYDRGWNDIHAVSGSNVNNKEARKWFKGLMKSASKNLPDDYMQGVHDFCKEVLETKQKPDKKTT